MKAQQALRIIFIRHAKSAGQDDPRLYLTLGDSKIPLTTKGIEQAYEHGFTLADTFRKFSDQGIPINFFYSRGRRTYQTAWVLASCFGKAVSRFENDPHFEKQKFGLFDGLLTNEERALNQPLAYASYVKELKELGAFFVKPPNGESVSDVYNRVEKGINALTSLPGLHFVVTHSLPFTCAKAYIKGDPYTWILQRQDNVKNCETIEFVVTPERI